MADNDTDSPAPGFVEALCVLICIALWVAAFWAYPVAKSMLTTTLAGGADGLGMGLFAMAFIFCGGASLGITIPLAIYAKKLGPFWRAAAMLPGGLSILFGAFVFLMLIVQGK